MEYILKDLSKEEAEYIGVKINGIVPRESDGEEKKLVLNPVR